MSSTRLLLAPFAVAAALAVSACGGGGGEPDRSTASAVSYRDAGAELLLEVIAVAAPGSTAEDGGVDGPLECVSPREGMEYYSVSYVVDATPDPLPRITSELTSRGFDQVSRPFEPIRPTSLFQTADESVSVVYFSETDLLRISIDTRCGTPGA